MKLKLGLFAALVILTAAGFFTIRYFSFVFSKTVDGEVTGLERITQPVAVVGTPAAASLFSFAVAIKTETGEIFTASSEDRQWGVVEKGQCVEARLFRYPPWDLQKAGTFFDARLLKIHDCPGKGAPK